MTDHRSNAQSQLLLPSHVFGLGSDVSSNMTYMDEQTLLYPAGSQLVLYNLEQKSQKFIPINEGEAMTTIQVNPAHGLAAIGLKSAEKGAHVVVMDLQNPRKKKLLMPAEGTTCKEIISVSFTNDMKNVVAQTGAPDWSLCYWMWEKPKLLATIKSALNNSTEIHQMTCNPFDQVNTQICVTGNSLFRVFKFLEGNFKLVHQQKPDKNLICHCWISEVRVIAGTEDSKLLVFDSGDLILEISYVLPGNVSMKTPSIQTVTYFSGGIIAGTSTGYCVLFEKTDDNFLYKKNKEFLLEESAVKCIALNPTDDVAVCTLQNSQIYVVTLDVDSTKGEEIKCDRLCQPFHHGQIHGMDTCARKPIIATCGTDKSIRIWNYVENTLEVLKFFDDEPLSISLHPSGLYVLVGFSDCLKLMNVLIDDIRPFWESNIRGCRESRFSNGGHYFATVYGSTIGIHKTWSFETVGYLKGHSGKVKSISWSADDSRVTSCGLDGSVFDWSVTHLKREGECPSPAGLFTSSCYASDLKTIYSISSDGFIRVVSDSAITQEIPGKVGYTAIATSRSGKYIFAATSKGSVKGFKSLIANDPSSIEQTEVSCHASPITRMRISLDDTYLFTCGEDGCLWVYKIQEKDQRGFKREKDWTYSDEILVTKSDLKEKQKLMHELRQRVETLKADNETQLKLKDLNYSEKLTDLTDKYMTEIEGLKQLTAVLTQDRKSNEEKYGVELNLAKVTNRCEIEEMDSSFRVKMAAESEKHKELMEKVAELKGSWERQMEDMELFHSSRVSQMTDYYKKKIQERQDDMLQLKSQYQEQQREFVQHLSEIEGDTDVEVLQIGFSFETKLKAEREALSAIKGENTSMKSKFNSLQKEIDDNKTSLNKMFIEEKRLHGIIKGLEKDIVGVKREMQERDDTIQDKEKRIYDLKKKNQELEKFKFVLDYKIAELKKQVEPREKDIVLLSTQIKEMDDELHQYQKTHDVLDTQIQDLLLKLRATQRDAFEENGRVHDMKTVVHRIQNDTRAIFKLLENKAALKRNLMIVFHKFSETSEEPEPAEIKARTVDAKQAGSDDTNRDAVAGGKQQAEALEEEIEEARQREHLERTASTLRHKLRKDEESRYAENLRIMHENVLLLTEINILRKDFQASKIRTQRLLGAVKRSDIDMRADSVLALEDAVKEFRADSPLMLLKSGVTKPLSLPALHNK